MRSRKLSRFALLASGIVATGIGGSILINPSAFYATYGIDPSGQVNLLNELRAAGGFLLATGLLIMSGAFVERLSQVAALAGALSFLAYGLSRGLSAMIDGMPASGLIAAALVEIAIGVVCLLIFVRGAGYARVQAGISPTRA